MNSFELTQLAMTIERLRAETEDARILAPNGGVSAALYRASVQFKCAVDELDPYIGRAVRDEARGLAA